MQKFYLWSNVHSAWWKPFALGYTDRVQEAGTYDASQVMRRLVNALDDVDWRQTREGPRTVAVGVEDGMAYYLVEVEDFEPHPGSAQRPPAKPPLAAAPRLSFMDEQEGMRDAA